MRNLLLQIPLDFIIISKRSDAEALRLAELYGIELVSYSYGAASFHTEEEPDAVVSRGVRNGWPRIEVNHLGQMYSD